MYELYMLQVQYAYVLLSHFISLRILDLSRIDKNLILQFRTKSHCVQVRREKMVMNVLSAKIGQISDNDLMTIIENIN